jgi:hypothetical protein
LRIRKGGRKKWFFCLLSFGRLFQRRMSTFSIVSLNNGSCVILPRNLQSAGMTNFWGVENGPKKVRY